jgi:heme/copper-type cytochrome/quinol oxidase subunit 2
MEKDSLISDSSTASRPLPQWLVKQKEGLNTYQPEKIVMREDRSLQTSFVVTGVFIILIISVLTVFVLRRARQLNTKNK